MVRGWDQDHLLSLSVSCNRVHLDSRHLSLFIVSRSTAESVGIECVIRDRFILWVIFVAVWQSEVFKHFHEALRNE